MTVEPKAYPANHPFSVSYQSKAAPPKPVKKSRHQGATRDRTTAGKIREMKL